VSPRGHTSVDLRIVTAQIGRPPREPWRVGALCAFGYPSVIVSPSVLADATPFPNYAWLTCPWLVERVGERESAGETARWAHEAREDAQLAGELADVDSAVREARAVESSGADACASVGIAGQRDPLGVKCLHAHVALALVGIDDPIGRSLLGKIGTACVEERCAGFADDPGLGGDA